MNWWKKQKTQELYKLSGNYKFHVDVEVRGVQNSQEQTISINCFSKSDKRIAIVAKYKWYRMKEEKQIAMKKINSNTYECSASDFGYIIKCEIASQEQDEYPGTAIVQIGPIYLEPQTRERLENILNLGSAQFYLKPVQKNQTRTRLLNNSNNNTSNFLSQSYLKFYITESEIQVFRENYSAIVQENKINSLKIAHSYNFPSIELSNFATQDVDFNFSKKVDQGQFSKIQKFFSQFFEKDQGQYEFQAQSRQERDLVLLVLKSFQTKVYLQHQRVLSNFDIFGASQKKGSHSFTSSLDNSQLDANKIGDQILEFDNLQSQISSLVTKNMELQKENQKQKMEFKKLEEELSHTITSFNKIIKDIKDGNVTARDSVADFSKILKNIPQQQQQYQQRPNQSNFLEDNSKILFKSDMLVESRIVDNEDNNMIKSELEGTKKLVDEYQQKYQRLEQNNDILLKELMNHQNDPAYQSDVNAKVMQLNKQISNLELQLKFEQTKKSQKDSNKVHQIQNLENQIKMSNQENQRLKQDVDKLAQTITFLERNSPSKKSELPGNMSMHSVLNNNANANSSFSIGEQMHKQDILIKEIFELKRQLEMAYQRNDVLSDKIKNLESEQQKMSIGQNQMTPNKSNFQVLSTNESDKKHIAYLEQRIRSLEKELQVRSPGSQYQQSIPYKTSPSSQQIQIERLEQELNQQEHKNQILTEQIKALQLENQSLKKVSMVESSNILQESQLYSTNAEIRKLEVKFEETKNLNLSLKRDLQQFKDRNKELERELNNLKIEKKYGSSTGSGIYNSSPKTTFEKLERDNEVLLQQRKQFEIKIQGLQKELENKTGNSQIAVQLESLRKTNDRLIQENGELIEMNRKLRQNPNSSIMDSSFHSHTYNMKQNYQQLENMNEILLQQVNDYKKQLQELPNSGSDGKQLAQQKNEIQRLNKKIEQLEREKNDSNRNYLQFSQSSMGNEDLIEEKYRDRIKAFKGQIEKLMRSNEKLVDENNDLLEENRKLQDTIFDLRNRSFSSQLNNTQNFAQQERINELEKQAEEYKKQIKKLQKESLGSNKDDNGLQKRLIEQLQCTNQRLVEENMQLSEEVRKLRDEIDLRSSFISRQSYSTQSLHKELERQDINIKKHTNNNKFNSSQKENNNSNTGFNDMFAKKKPQLEDFANFDKKEDILSQNSGTPKVLDFGFNSNNNDNLSPILNKREKNNEDDFFNADNFKKILSSGNKKTTTNNNNILSDNKYNNSNKIQTNIISNSRVSTNEQNYKSVDKKQQVADAYYISGSSSKPYNNNAYTGSNLNSYRQYNSDNKQQQQISTSIDKQQQQQILSNKPPVYQQPSISNYRTVDNYASNNNKQSENDLLNKYISSSKEKSSGTYNSRVITSGTTGQLQQDGNRVVRRVVRDSSADLPPSSSYQSQQSPQVTYKTYLPGQSSYSKQQ